ncbi:DUF5979 domain-containing protein [Aeromicrobium fastidiosum]|uniref:DUF11 domain-containing protein n=1 Tax=Aeromicrobium fastidiosum TaxID=52699 RepID=A0A641AQC6_9ACTN|nr:DUF5979 domain-containing protein [Aeromicrobium fastidiosum]KAA1380306.1 DUF11 domain-containing protein [Aeromicrobium fastidiosum]MBP2389861.1 putative repeat protein (TIGR01451 family)/fimbrial isopeptide formation D2 family protein [Aeromicrobium fastidiosum]
MSSARHRTRQQHRTSIRSGVVLATLFALLLPVIPAQADPVPVPSPSPETTATATPEPSPAPTKKTDPTEKNDQKADRAPVAAAADSAQVGVVKSNNLDGKTLKPGDDFAYELTVECSSLVTDCVNETFTDVLPEGLTVTNLPPSTSTRTVTFDQTTRKLTVVFKQALQDPVGEVGLRAGGTVNFEIGMRLPADTALLDGTEIANTADVTADNATPKDDTNVVTVEVPRVVRPVATKTWTDGSAVAGLGEASTVTLGVRNASSSSAKVTDLSIVDQTATTFEHFDLTGLELKRFPAGANRAVLSVKTGGGWVDAAAVSSTGALGLPSGVSASDVTAVRVVFTDVDGGVLPYDATGGSVEMGLVLRDTTRSDDAPMRPTTKIAVNNCAEPAAEDADSGTVTGADACHSYDILPDTLVLGSSKTYFADTDKDFTRENGEYAVIGRDSRVSAKVDVSNKSPFELSSIVITEPDPTSTSSELEKLDIDTVRLRLPAGAAKAALTVTYADGTVRSEDHTTGVTLAVAKTGTRVVGVQVTYTGRDGDPTIDEGAVAGLDLSGHLNSLVTSADLPNGSSPHVVNCAGYQGSAGRTDGTGTASGTACANLTVELPRNGSTGVKTVGQTSVPEGQPIPFGLKVTNNGNLPLVDPVISDPPTGVDGRPDPTRPNPFTTLRITSAKVSATGLPPVAIELYDPTVTAWVAYDASDAALLERAQGVRAAMNGELAPTQGFTLDLVTQRRAGTADAVKILNCFTTSADGYVADDPACSPEITTGPVSDAASINKSITPGDLPAYVPGLPRQYATVELSATNTGNLSMSTLRLTDADTDFFDAVDFVDFGQVKLPAGADRVRIDALVAGSWVTGTAAANPALPSGVSAASVTGIRATFSHSSGDPRITPCAKPADCGGVLKLRVSPRQFLRSDSSTTIPRHMENSASAEFVTRLQDPSSPKTVAPVRATLNLNDGAARLAVQKTPDSTIAPGDPAPFKLKVTNTGTSNITDLVVKDVLPAGLQLDETYVGDGGEPFRIVDTQVPSGTPAVPKPVLDVERDGGRVSGLAFDFGKTADGDPWLFAPGATLTIEIQVLLEPGVGSGQVITNTMGAIGKGPNLACDGTSATDSAFGSGTYCTDTAAVTVRAGAAFQARKWVAGTVSRGWYNTRTAEAVPVGDPSCPVATDAAGVEYTAHPCIAMVDPGDRYDYLLRLVNAGTESATDMRIIDRFPAPGDRGVHVDQARGTEWDKRPTLATQPKLTGKGALTTSYTDRAGLCIADLDMGGAGSSAAQCAPGDWSTPFGPGVTAAQMRLTFATPLEPAEGVDITFSMNTPLDIEQVSDPTIAWNSYAHAETTLRGGRPHVLPRTEPIKVGVGLAYGALHLEKKIGDNPSNLPLAGLTFPFHVVCTIDPVGGTVQTVLDDTYQVSSTTPVDVTGLPAGASCSVSETDAKGGISDHPASDPLTIAIEPGMGQASVQTATITNDFADAELAVEKSVTGGASDYAAAEFDVNLFCSFGGAPLDGLSPQALTVKPAVDDGRVVTKVPAGASCYAVETDTGSATAVTYDPAGPSADRSGAVSTTSKKRSVIGVTNEFRAGGLSIAKELAGPGAPSLSDGPFTFAVACSFDGKANVFTKNVTLTGDGSSKLVTSPTMTGLPVGAVCTVTETDNGGADETPVPATVTIPDEVDGEPQVVVAGLTNVFSAGTISLSKVLAGAGADKTYAADAVFTVQVTCERDVANVRTTVFSGPVQIKGGQTLTIEGSDGKPLPLPLGTHCFGTETVTGGATTAVVDHDSFDKGVVVTTSSEVQKLALTATNRFDLGAVAVTKTVDGAGAPFVAGRTYAVEVTCVLPQGGPTPTVLFAGKKLSLTGGQTLKVDDLPIGAQCWAGESDGGGATRTTISHDSATTPATVVADRTAGIEVVNTFDTGRLKVSKKVVGPGEGRFSFTLTCTTPRGDVPLKDSVARFTLTAGQSRVFEVPLGASCIVREVDVPDDADVSYKDSTGKGDGKVVVGPSASVTVTNTFAAVLSDNASDRPDADRDDNGNGILPGTGGARLLWLVTGLGLVLAGVVVTRTARRRA